MLELRTINLLWALVTGGVGYGRLDLWDCDPWVEFIRIHIMPDMFRGEKFVYNQIGFQAYIMNYRGIGPFTVNEKKKAGVPLSPGKGWD